VDAWEETYRGTVYRWEVDHNDHLTVAYYFSRLGDATVAMLEGLGLGRAYAERTGRACVTADCYVRYVRELRAGDLMHVSTAVIGVEDDALRLGHRLVDSATGDVCTTFEQRVAHVGPGRAAAPLDPDARRAAAARQTAWDGPAREAHPRPRGGEGFVASARDVLKPAEIDALGQPALSAYIHRFSAANGHALNAFGFTPEYMRRERRGFSTFEFQCTFSGGLRAGDVVAVRSALTHLGNSSLRLLHVMTSERSGETVATLEQSGVHFDLQARRPAPLPDALRERARAVLVRVG
jgi:acyl-CoA thioester hydrolase